MTTLSNRINNLSESATIKMAKMGRELAAKGIDVINLSFGEPDFNTPKHIKEAAKKAIAGGKSFGDAAKEAGAKDSDIDLGLISKDRLIDPKIADAVFSLTKDTVSDPVEGRFATVLLRVSDIQPAVNRTFPDVKDQVKDKGLPYKVGKVPFQAIAKAIIAGEYDGFAKVISNTENQDILGVHIVGPHATDLIAEASLAFELDATAWEVGGTTHAHPTLAEVIGEAAMAVEGRSINF